MTYEQCCQVIGVSSDASAQEIKDAYLMLVKAWHPDRFSSDSDRNKAEAKLKEINNAYEQIRQSANRPRYEQRGKQYSNQPARGSSVSAETESTKRKPTCLVMTVIGALVFVTACGLIGIVIWGNPFKDKLPISKDAETASDRERRYLETVPKTAEISFTPNALIPYEDDDIKYRIQLMEMASYNDGRASLKVSICNVSNKNGVVEMKYWYTPANNQNTVYLNPVGNSRVFLRPNACEVQDHWGELGASTSFRLTRPFGKLNVSEGGKDIVGVIDLKQADSQGYIRFKNETDSSIATPPSEMESDIRSLQGVWQAQSGSKNGESFSRDLVARSKLIINDGELTMKGARGKDSTEIFNYRIDSTKSPKHLDFISVTDMRRSLLAIYELDGDELKICLLGNNERPENFQDVSGESKSIIVFKKAK